MTATFQLTPEERAQVMADATAQAADRILADALLTRQQAAKVLGISLTTLNLLPLKRAKIGGKTRYRMADLKAYVETTLER